MVERFRKRILEGLASLSRRLERARQPADRSETERQIGRLLQRNSRAARQFVIKLVDAPERGSKLRVVWTEHPEWTEWAMLSEGAYVLRSNVANWSAEDLWQTYVQLCQAEAAFRIHKTELGIRPIWHQREERVQAHILVCFLAFAMWKTLEGWTKQAGLGASPRKLLDELAAPLQCRRPPPARGRQGAAASLRAQARSRSGGAPRSDGADPAAAASRAGVTRRRNVVKTRTRFGRESPNGGHPRPKPFKLG